MASVHAHASGMGGIRTAGDLVARVMFQKKMKLPEAKKYVAEKLNVPVLSLTDEIVMRETREDLGLGTVFGGYGHAPKGIEAKFNIAKVLDININCVDKFIEKTGMKK